MVEMSVFIWIKFLKPQLIQDRIGSIKKAEYETAYDKAGSVLEHVFDFLEAAFEPGQEMVWFITELNSGFYSVQFLQEYAGERYQRYNRELLFDQGRQKILERIQAL